MRTADSLEPGTWFLGKIVGLPIVKGDSPMLVMATKNNHTVHPTGEFGILPLDRIEVLEVLGEVTESMFRKGVA